MLTTRELELLVLLLELFFIVIAIILFASGQATRSGWISLLGGGVVVLLLEISIWVKKGASERR